MLFCAIKPIFAACLSAQTDPCDDLLVGEFVSWSYRHATAEGWNTTREARGHAYGKIDIELSSAVATIDMGRKVWGGCCAFFPWGSWIPIQHNVAWAEAYLRTKWHLDPSNRLATIHQRYRHN